ncbi:hypothetical protein HWV62_37205 [Athelia sp. TMB]|nr:hypothetical protein HWV62_37205 [Athelia sp. TMB]
MSTSHIEGSPSDPYDAERPQDRLDNNTRLSDDESSTIRTHESPPTGGSSDRETTRTPVSPSPQQAGPSEMTRDLPPHLSTNEYRRGTPIRASPAIPPPTQQTMSITSTSSHSPPAVRFENLEGRIPIEQIQSLRVFVSHLGLQNQKLRLTGDHLGNLGSEVRELREHTSSLTRRIDRATGDNARFLVESEGHIAELSRIFDTPHGQPLTAAPANPGAIDAAASLTQLSTAPILQSESASFQRARDDGYDRHVAGNHAPQSDAPPDAREDSQSEVSVSNISGRAASSRSSLPPRGPGESTEQYDSRYEANIRRVNQTQGAWSRHYESGAPRHPGSQPAATRDTRFLTPAPQHPALHDPRFEGSAPMGDLGRTTDPTAFDSISRPLNPYAGITAPPIGVSAYRVTQGPVTNGIWQNDHYHYVVLLGRVAQIIKFKVGAPFEIPAGFKQPKLHEPSKYAGSHSHDEFMDWLSEFLNWLRGHYICGPTTDSVRIIYLGLSITGAASDWFTTEIDNPSRHYDPPLLFSDCVCLMHKRFVRTATANDAAVKYNAVRYSSVDGVEGLYYKLDRAAERMIERPNEYEFRRRLFNLLPVWLHDKLRDRNIIPEYATLEDIRENTRQLEENALRTYEGVEELASSRPRPPKAQARAPLATSTPRAAVDARTGSRGNPTPTAKAAAAPAPRTRDRPARDKSGLTCYGCGKLGHISSDPVCENYDANRARMHMQHEVNADDDPPEPLDEDRNDALPEEYAQSWGGSQYASDEELIEDTGADVGEQPRLGAMYTVRVAAMRVLDEDALDEQSSGPSDMPPLVDVSDDENENIPVRVISDRGRPELPRPLRTRFITDYRDPSSEPIISSIVVGDRRATLNLPHYGLSAMSIEESVARTWARGSLDDWDNGRDFTAANSPSPLRVSPPYVRHTGEGTAAAAPSEHLPDYNTVRAVSTSVWMDTRERILAFAEPEHLDNYNRRISLVVMCWACGHCCRPTVFQRLARLPRGIHPGTYLTTYICHFAGRPEGEATSVGPPPLVGEDSEDSGSDEDYESDSGGYADGHGYVDDGDEYGGPLGEYSSSLYAMRMEHSANIRRAPLAGGAISRPNLNQNTISCMVTINGHQALTLFDSGSTTDSITPEFGFASRTRQFKLEEQITLQLGCIGSRSKIVYGAVAPISVAGIVEEMYFDVVNIDKYDAILGTPFLHRHGILLDFKRGGIIASDKFFKSFSLSEELAFIAQKRGGRDEKRGSRARAAPRETAPIKKLI